VVSCHHRPIARPKTKFLPALLWGTVGLAWTGATGATSLTPPTGYTKAQLLIEDQFAAPSLDTTKWNPWLGQKGVRWCNWTTTATLPNPYSGETLARSKFNLEYYDPYPYGGGSNTSGNHLVGGNGLQLVASKSTYFGSLGYSWAAAAISGTGKKMIIPATGGYLQVSAKMPDMSQGAWPALWMLPETGSGNSAWDWEFGYTRGGHPNFVSQLSVYGDRTTAVVTSPTDLTTAYHTYGIEYRPASSSKTNDGKMSFYLDRKLVGSYPSPQTGSFEVIILLQMAKNAAGWHSVVGANTVGPYVMHVANVQIYSL
jgi:hypothetical protein